jgi:hypothetical protein
MAIVLNNTSVEGHVLPDCVITSYNDSQQAIKNDADNFLHLLHFTNH